MVSCFFTIVFPGFSDKVYPQITPTKLPGQTNRSNYQIDILNGPKVEGLTAEVCFQIVDPVLARK